MDAHLKEIKEVPCEDVKVHDIFWTPKINLSREVTIKACLDKCEETGRIKNFEKAAVKKGSFEGIFFNDSDVYKVIEGASYALMSKRDEKLEERIDGIIEKIEKAQMDDGYLDTYYVLTCIDKRWTDMGMHEMYCGGHLIEAAVSYKKATGKDKLLNIARRMADHYMSVFGPGKKDWVPGHPEIELALVKLYRETQDEKYLDFAEWLLNERGHGNGRGSIWNDKDWGTLYCQDDKPFAEQSHVSGHAVRAMYLYSGAADIAFERGNIDYIKALDRLWDSIVLKNMYVTGGIGQSAGNEGFTSDYDLPNLTAYCETCASVGMVMFNHRMNMLKADARYADVAERAMYNGSISGVSLKGDEFFYVNPLESKGDHHRQKWYDCSCCPTQIARFIPSIANYAYLTDKCGIYVNMFLDSESKISINDKTVLLRQETMYPWDGHVLFTFKSDPDAEFELRLRYPSWCDNAWVRVNGEFVKADTDLGYMVIKRRWRIGDAVEYGMDMTVKWVHADPKVKEDEGKVCIQRGPVVYCLEGTDNPGIDLNSVKLPKDAKFTYYFDYKLLGGVAVLKTKTSKGSLTFVPYYAWDNREHGPMKVWIDEDDGEFINLYGMY